MIRMIVSMQVVYGLASYLLLSKFDAMKILAGQPWLTLHGCRARTSGNRMHDQIDIFSPFAARSGPPRPFIGNPGLPIRAERGQTCRSRDGKGFGCEFSFCSLYFYFVGFSLLPVPARPYPF